MGIVNNVVKIGMGAEETRGRVLSVVLAGAQLTLSKVEA